MLLTCHDFASKLTFSVLSVNGYKTYSTSEEVLAAVFALPSDADIFDNDLDGCSGSRNKNNGAEVGYALLAMYLMIIQMLITG